MFWLLWIMLQVNIGVYVYILMNKCFQVFWVDHRRGIAVSYGSFILIFFFWGTSILFFIMAVSVYTLTTSMRVPFYPRPFQHLLFLVLLIIAILTGVRWYWNVLWFLNFISFRASEVGHLFLHLLTTGISSWEQCLISSPAHFLIGLFSC